MMTRAGRNPSVVQDIKDLHSNVLRNVGELDHRACISLRDCRQFYDILLFQFGATNESSDEEENDNDLVLKKIANIAFNLRMKKGVKNEVRGNEFESKCLGFLESSKMKYRHQLLLLLLQLSSIEEGEDNNATIDGLFTLPLLEHYSSQEPKASTTAPNAVHKLNAIMNQLPGDVHFHSPLSEDKDQEKNKGYWKEPEPEAYETSNLFGAIRHQTIDPKLARYQELNFSLTLPDLSHPESESSPKVKLVFPNTSQGEEKNKKVRHHRKRESKAVMEQNVDHRLPPSSSSMQSDFNSKLIRKRRNWNLLSSEGLNEIFHLTMASNNPTQERYFNRLLGQQIKLSSASIPVATCSENQLNQYIVQVMSGLPSIVFHWNDSTQSFVLEQTKSKIRLITSGCQSIVKILTGFANMGTQLKYFQRISELFMNSSDQITRAFGTAMDQYIHSYHAYLLSYICCSIEKMSLIQLTLQTQTFRDQFQQLYQFFQHFDWKEKWLCRGKSLLNDLYLILVPIYPIIVDSEPIRNQDHSKHRSNSITIRSGLLKLIHWLFLQSVAPYLALVSKWLFYGNVDPQEDPFNEFNLKAILAFGSQLSTSKKRRREVLFHESQIFPIFLQNALGDHVLRLGHTLHLLKLYHPKLYCHCTKRGMPSLSFPSTTIGDTIESPVLHMLRMNLKNLQSYTHDYQLAQLRASQQHQEIRSESYRDQLSEIQSSQQHQDEAQVQARQKKRDQMDILEHQIKLSRMKENLGQELELEQRRETHEQTLAHEQQQDKITRHVKARLISRYGHLFQDIENRHRIFTWRLDHRARLAPARACLRNQLLREMKFWTLERDRRNEDEICNNDNYHNHEDLIGQAEPLQSLEYIDKDDDGPVEKEETHESLVDPHRGCEDSHGEESLLFSDEEDEFFDVLESSNNENFTIAIPKKEDMIATQRMILHEPGGSGKNAASLLYPDHQHSISPVTSDYRSSVKITGAAAEQDQQNSIESLLRGSLTNSAEVFSHSVITQDPGGNGDQMQQILGQLGQSQNQKE